ncbi:uncharacterized protein LOC108913546 [Anoplophora glabripennis]|uniref:uncharacterized protein LOC108913546 n=1 Tax=Anoplophora glabripennis TaxID=217634 RepID=UPI0008757EF6|nr:uncharacterized protein LOC108913546 [Anoplophora glabripennis]
MFLEEASNGTENSDEEEDEEGEEDEEMEEEEFEQVVYNKYLEGRNYKFSGDHLSSSVSRLKELQKNESITILPAAKGNATVVLSTVDYIAKEENLLLDPIYKNIRNNRIKNAEKKDFDPNRLKNTSAILLAKDSPNIPLLPTVSAVGSATHPLVRYIAQEKRDLVGGAEHHVKNARDFIDRIREIELQPGNILVSFDVTSLFTKVPVDEALEELHRRLIAEDKDESLMNLAKVCIKSTFFAFRDEFYEQTKGAAMGSALYTVLANIYMEAFENKALESTTLKPKCWHLYIDDNYIILPHGRNTVVDFLDHINGIHPDIQFIMEVEKKASLLFLDFLVERKSDGTLGHRKRNIKTVFSTVKKVAAAIPKTCNNDQLQAPGVYNTVFLALVERST